MAVDVIIDPLTGQIYWNDSQGTAQSIAISGNGTDLIKTVGYSLQFSAAPAGTITTGSATTAVSGSGTNFLTLFGSGAAGSGAVLYTSQGTSIGTISTVSSDTALSLQANASGSYTGITFRYSPPAGTDRLILSDSSTPIYPATTGANLGTSSYRWSLYASLGDITNSGTTAINLMLDKSGIGSTESPALQFINTTAATSGAQYQFAPWNEFRGKAWNTGSLASNDVRMRMGMAALSGNTPTSEFVIASSVDTGTASWYYPLTLNATANDSVLYLNNGVISIGKLLTNGTTSSYALELYNYNLATSGQTANWSPAFEMNGSAWNTSTATSNILRFRSEVQTTSGNPISGSIFWKSAITTSYSATPSFSNNLSLSNTNGLGLWNANTAASYLKASGSQASDIVYTFPASAPTTNQVLSASSVSGSSITLTWSTSASGSGTVNSGASGKVAYYPSLGTAVDDATALDYSTTSPHLTVTAQATTAIPLKLVGIASQSVDLFQVATSGANVFTVGSAGISTFANSTAASGTTSGALIITGGIGVGSTSYLSTTNITTLTLTNALAVGQGGTGTSTAPNQWGVIFATSTSQYNSTAAGSADQVLKSGGGTGAPSFGAINLASSNAVSNTLALSNGGLGTTTFTQNGVLYGNAATSILVTSASGAAGAILQTTTSGGVPSFSTTLPGTYSFSSSTAASSTTVAAVVFSGGIGVGSTSYLSDLYTVGTIFSATSATTVNISTSASTKTINIGTGGTSSHTTTITIGTTAGTSTLTIDSPTVATNTTSLTLFNTNATTVNAFGAGTALTLGAITGTTTIRNTTVALTNATSITGTSAAITMFGESTTFTLMGTTAASTTNIATGNNGANAKILNLATGGAGAGASNVNVGVATGTFTVNSATSNIGTTAVSGVVAILSSSFTANNATTFSATSATSLSLGASTGTATIGNTTFTLSNATSITGTSAAITMFGESTSFTLMGTTATSTINIATGNNGTNAKTLNLATGGAGAGASNVNVGVATGTFTVNSATSNIGTTAVSGTVAVLSSTFTANNATTFSATSATTLSLGASTGTATIGNTTFTLTNATSITGTSAAITMFGESTTFTLMATTATSTTNIATGNNGTNAKTLNLATGGTGAGAVNVNVGVSTGTFTVNSATSNIGTTAVSGTVAVLSSTFTANNATTFSATSATTLSLGASTGTATIGNTTFTLTNATSITGTSAAITMFGESTSFTLMGTTATSTINIASGNNAANAKTVNIATGGTGAGNSNINIGVSTGTTSVKSSTFDLANATSITGSASLATVFATANPASLALFGSATTVTAFAAATTLSIGSTAGTITIANSTATFSGATANFSANTAFNLGTSVTGASTINIGTGAVAGAIKAINIGTGGSGTGTSTIIIGTTSGTSTITLNGVTTLSSALAVGSGGTGTSSAPTQWGVIFATSTSAYNSTAAGSTNQWLRAVTSGAPTWSTATLATTYSQYDIVYASASNGLSGLTNSNTSVLVSQTAGPVWLQGATGNRLLKTSGSVISWSQADLTTDVTGILPIANGGTQTSSITAGGVVYMGSTAATGLQALSPAAANKFLVSTGTATTNYPAWSTATLATTYASGDLLYASSSNTVGGLTSTATSVLITQGAAAPSWLQGATGNRLLKTSGSAISWGQVDLASGDVTGTLPVGNGGTGQTTYTDGQLLIGNTTGNTLTKATLTPGTNISITNGNGSITINATSSGSGTVNSGAAGKIAYYPTATTTVDDAAALDYSTTTTHLTITAQGASTSPLELVGAASQTANFLNVKNSAGTSLISFATTSSGSGAKLLIQGTSSNQDDLLRIENSGTYTITGGYAGQRGLRVVYRTNGNNTADRYFWSISRGYDGFGFFNFGCDETTGVGLTIGSASEGFPLSAKVIEDATTDTVKDVINIERTTSGTAAAGIGGRISFRQEHAGGTLVNTIGIDGLLSNAGSTTYVGALSIKTNSAGTTTLSERVRIDNTSVQLSPIGTSAGNTNELRFLELAATGSNYIAFKAPDSIATNYTYVLPDAAPSAGQLLSASAPSGGVVTLSWATDQLGTSGGGITSLNALTAASQSFANDTNVTITSATATHTLGWQGTLAVGRGGTGTSTTPTQWGVAYGLSASALAYTGAGASGQLLLAVTSNAPQWGTMSGDASIGNTGVVTIANSAVTFAKMQNSAAAGLSVIGRSTNSAGAFAEIATTTDGAVLRLSGTTLGFGSINLATTNAVTGILPVGNGGTGTSTAPTQWGITFATSTSQYASTAAGSTNQWIRAVTSGAPTWSTATLATTYAAGDLLYASAGNTVGGLTSTATSVLITQGAAGPSWLQGATGNRLLKTSGSAISWGQVDLASGDVTGTLAVGSGGTGTSSFAVNTILTSGATTTGAVTTATAMVYSASSQHLTITAQGAATSPLRLVGTTSQTADLFQVFSTSAGTLLGSVGAFGGATFTSLATSATTPATALVITGAAHTALNTATEYSDAYFNFGQTKTFTSGAITTLRTFRVAPATYAFSGASTVTNAATLQIDGAPTAGTNATLTETAALRILTGTASGKGLVIRGATSQTGTFIDVQNNSGTSLVTLGTTNINLAPHGASAGNTFELRFSELAATGSNYIAFKAPDDIATTYTYVLPSAAPSAGQLLSASAPSAGVVTLSWATDQLGTSGGGITSLNGLAAASQSFANDTNVTITSATATHTLGWQGELAISRGGTGTSTAPTQWGVMFATSATAIRSTAAAGSTNQWLASVSAGAPVWSTATLATTYAAGDLLYASAGNVVGGLTSTATSVLITQGAAAPSWLQGATGNRLLKTSGSAISWGQVDLASGDVTGTLAVGSGGTGTSTAPTQWGVMFATSASAIRSTAAPTSTNQLLAGVSGGAPVWSTATFATTYSVGQFLYASGANAVSGLATTTFSVDTTNIRIGVGTSAASSPLHVLNNATATNTVVVMKTIDAQSTGTPAAGFGGSILFDLESSTTAAQDAASIETVWATATHATRLAELNFKTNDVNTSTLTERMSISNITSAQSSTNATVVITGTLGVNSTSYLSSLSLNTALAITSGGTNTSSFATSNGLVYFNGTNLLTTNAAASGIVVTSGANVPSVATDIPTAVTIGSGYIYRGGGTDVPLADGGTNASLTANQGGVIYSTNLAMAINTPGSSGQPLLSGGTGAPTFGTLGMGAGGTGLTTTAPGANFVLGMNSSNNGLEYKQLVQGSNITITHAANQVTITASGGSATPGGSNTQIQYNNAGALGGISNFTFASNLVSLTNATNFANASTPGMELKYNTAAGTTTVNNNSPALDFIGRIYASAADRHARIRQEIQTTAATPSHALVWSSSYDTGTASYTRVLSVHSVDGLGFWNYAGTPGSAANYFKTGNQASDIRYTWPTTAPTTNQVLSATGVTGSDITLGWATAGGGAGTVGSGTINQLAYYSGATTTASDASLVRAATGTHLTITAQGATTSPLKVVGASAQSAALFTVATSGADVLVVGSAGAITTGTWNGTAIGVLYGGTGQTTYTDGQLLIGNSTGNTLTKASLTAGNGIGVTNGAGSITVRTKRVMNIQLASGFNPPVGADTAIIRIPESPTDGTTSVTYNVRKVFCRVETPSSGTSTFQVEYYTGTSAFSGTNLLSSAMSVTGAAVYEFNTTGFTTSTLATGAKIRLNFSAVNVTHANFSINLLLEEN